MLSLLVYNLKVIVMEGFTSPIKTYKRARNFSFSYNSTPKKSRNGYVPFLITEQKKSIDAPSQTSARTSDLAKQQEEQSLFLPKIHPHNICIQGAPKKTVVVKKNRYKKKKAFSRLKHFETLAEEMSDPNKEYEGIFRNGYMSDHDRQKAENREKKKKNIAGLFKLYSGVASAIPLRKEGAVRPHGAYFDKPEDIMYNRQKPSLLEGPWRPGASVAMEISPIRKPRKLRPLESKSSVGMTSGTSI